ncbi:MAG TPA: helix-turn-helix transcriptional regulator [Terrimesophilobacter sp.]|nr:helix-turn-helix transcriptional regulator [Terrimesophilobacter sp.]
MPSDSLFPPPNVAALRLNLARIRHARGYSYDELAARSGVARSTLAYIESGSPNRNPSKAATVGSLTTWYRLSRALDVPLGQLLEPLFDDEGNG